MTRAAVRLKKVGLEVRSRPYSYADTPQLDLDSLVLYTTGLKMSVSNEPCMDAHHRLDPVNILIYMWAYGWLLLAVCSCEPNVKANSVLHYLTMPCGEKKLLAEDRGLLLENLNSVHFTVY